MSHVKHPIIDAIIASIQIHDFVNADNAIQACKRSLCAAILYGRYPGGDDAYGEALAAFEAAFLGAQ